MRQIKTFIFGVIILFTFQSVVGQTIIAESSASKENEPRNKSNLEVSEAQIVSASGESGVINDEIIKETGIEKKEFKALITPDAADLARYRVFLKQSRTGLFRLSPDYDCESKFTVKIDGKCAATVPGTFGYSFYSREHTIDEKNLDISLKNDEIISKGFLSQGILTALGDIPIENVSLNSQGLKFLINFKPETEIEAVKKQYQQISSGINADGFAYNNARKAEINTTYALRLVNYHIPPIKNKEFFSRTDDKRFAEPENDKRKDLILVFRVVRKDTDGRITVVWKELSRQTPPKLVFPANEKMSDFKPKQ